jgi:hypothetical protein
MARPEVFTPSKMDNNALWANSAGSPENVADRWTVTRRLVRLWPSRRVGPWRLLWPSTKLVLSIQSIITSVMAALPKGPPPLKMLKKRIHTRVANPTPSNAGDR